MNLSFGKKFVLFLHWLLSLLIAALAVMLCFWPDLVKAGFDFADRLAHGWADVVGLVLLGIYVVFAVLSVALIFSGKKKRIDRAFITVDSSEAGRTRIAISAVDQMIRQAVRSVDGIVDMKSSILNCEDAVSINTSVTIVSGAHVPTVTMNMQRAVRSYIELNCGVAVREVSVSVNAMENSDEGSRSGRRKAMGAAPAAVVPAMQTPTVEEASAVAEAASDTEDMCADMETAAVADVESVQDEETGE